MEHLDENVQLGKLLDESSYNREKGQVMIDETVNIDFIKDWKVLHEVKKSKAIEEAGIWQLKYYMYFLKQKGIIIEKGVVDYPKLRQRETIFLTTEDERKIEKILVDIEITTSSLKPPTIIDKPLCKKCAYYEYCYI
ncbi:CRISPR-associated RecB family exonuclease Cas4a [Listeria monocytogenes]|nr:CRISPR-associated RecB family exonuclease Cas4a [Listeria monocytogenes]